MRIITNILLSLSTTLFLVGCDSELDGQIELDGEDHGSELDAARDAETDPEGEGGEAEDIEAEDGEDDYGEGDERAGAGAGEEVEPLEVMVVVEELAGESEDVEPQDGDAGTSEDVEALAGEDDDVEPQDGDAVASEDVEALADGLGDSGEGDVSEVEGAVEDVGSSEVAEDTESADEVEGDAESSGEVEVEGEGW